MSRPRNRPQPDKLVNAAQADLNDGIAPKVETTRALSRLGASNTSIKLPKLVFAKKFTEGKKLLVRVGLLLTLVRAISELYRWFPRLFTSKTEEGQLQLRCAFLAVFFQMLFVITLER